MPLYVSAATKKSYPPASSGTHAAVCVDVVDMGDMEQEFNGRVKMVPKIRIVWQIAEDREDGKPFTVGKLYTRSLHEKSALRGVLESWRGKVFTEDELKQFDLENLLGAPAFLSLIHVEKNGRTYANVSAIMKLNKGTSAPTVRDYVRVCERQTEAEPVGINGGGDHFEIDDDSVPF